MEDQAILQLYYDRSETAIVQTDAKYGGYCYSIAYRILTDREDAEESVNDTYFAAWNNIPPRRPNVFSAFLGKLTRYISINRWKTRSAYKRGGGEMELALEELSECVSGGQTPEEACAYRETVRALRAFLDTLPETERRVFLRRYWYLDSTREICQRYGFSESKVKSMLHRVRRKLHAQLEQEGLL